MADLKKLVHERKYVRKLVTEGYNNRDHYLTASVLDKESLKASMKDYLERLKGLNERIQDILWQEDDADKINDEFSTCEEYCSRIRQCLIIAGRSSEVAGRSSEIAGSSGESARSLLKSPTAPLPKFTSTEGEDLDRFFREFEDTIHKYSYPDYDKLILLKQQISGRALILVNSLEADKQGYIHAKNLLTAALASPDIQRYNTIKQLTEIKMTYDTDPFEYIAKMRVLTESITKLSIDKDSFLQYFFWNGLNESFKTQLIQITNHTRPTLKEINDNFFEACERYRSAQKYFKDKNKSGENSNPTHSRGSSNKYLSGLAAQVKYTREDQSKTYISCSICSKIENIDPSHPIFKCPNFPSAEAKIAKLRSLKGCLKCANFSHSTEFCRYRFRSRCQHCSDWHFSFLCQKGADKKDYGSKGKDGSENKIRNDPKNPITAKKPEAKNSSKSNYPSKVTTTEAWSSNLDSNAILPTFTCLTDNQTKIRGLKDGGCQSNFITASLAESLHLTVLKDNLKLTVNGINVSHEYSTQLVEITLYFGHTKRVIQALCLPIININLRLPKLESVVSGFVAKGYKLADDYLLEGGNGISDVDFILGTKAGYCVPDREVVFGRDKSSIYSQTPIGIMLKGDSQQLYSDLNYLPVAPPISSEFGVNSSFPENVHSSSCVGILGRVTCLSSCMELGEGVSKASPFSVINKDGSVIETELQKATSEILESKCNYYTNYDIRKYDEDSSEIDDKLVKFTLTETNRGADGRLVMPLLWNSKVSHLLGRNYHLSKVILKSNLDKFKKDDNKLKMIDETFKEQEKVGIIEKIENLDQYLKDHPQHSFLPHMPVFKLDRETTKCRVVFLSNLCERDTTRSLTLSHNQAIYSGPCLNQKITSALLHLRFDCKLLCFDVQKAFNNIVLNEVDQNRLLFLWYRNVARGDFSLVGYKNVRLSFGLRCSPTLLMLGLYKILILDTENDSDALRNLKQQIYQLSYMDNCALTMNNSYDLKWAYEQLIAIFGPYRFGLQQFVTNDRSLQEFIDSDLKLESETPSSVKLLGLMWERRSDTLATRPITLDVEACTKRAVLSTIASQFDLFSFNGPLLNRSRLFLHELQCNKSLGWDQKFSPELVRRWKVIAKQANSAPEITIARSVGNRDDPYKLIAFADSSKLLFGAVVFIQNLRTKLVSFVLAKNRIVSKQLESKSIPSLEIQGIALATECLIDLYKELSEPDCVNPINITELNVYSDSLVSLSWLNSFSNKLDKMQKRSTFVLNRLHNIARLCECFPVRFSFVSGLENPGDCITRCFSHKQLLKTNYLTGPDFLTASKSEIISREDTLSLIIPNPMVNAVAENVETSNFGVTLGVLPDKLEYLGLLERCSSFRRVIKTYQNVLIFVNKLKLKLRERNLVKYSHIEVKDQTFNFFLEAGKAVILNEQAINFPDVLEYYSSTNKCGKDIPNLVSQLNIYVDRSGIMRVNSKFSKHDAKARYFPILLPKGSRLTQLLIQEYHASLSHAGCYSILSELRKKYWIPHYFSTVKRAIKECIVCRRLNERTIKLNQNSYRAFRCDPPKIPFRYLFVDHIGPYYVKINGKKEKVWVLCITCLWCRAINLKLCTDLTVKEFLRAFQLHCFEFGLPEYCLSDLGSQLVAGANIIRDFLKEPDTKLYFDEKGVKPISFEQYFKGRSELGGLVESCVKLTKRLIYGSIKNNVLNFRDFEYLICQTVHLVNRRPVAFKEALRDLPNDSVPEPITPEMLLRGYSLISVNLIPDLQADPEAEPEWMQSCPQDKARESYSQLRKVRSNLVELYHAEFVASLISQATDIKGRYKPVTHKVLQKGDVVLIKEPLAKPSNYPMGVVIDVTVNSNSEVTGALIRKGQNREVVKRHSSSLIPLLSVDPSAPNDLEGPTTGSTVKGVSDDSGVKRKAAVVSGIKTRVMLDQNLV